MVTLKTEPSEEVSYSPLKANIRREAEAANACRRMGGGDGTKLTLDRMLGSYGGEYECDCPLGCSAM
jgi:hypothetical protein